jgi:recombination protein RecR
MQPEVTKFVTGQAGELPGFINTNLSTLPSRLLDEAVSEFSRLPGIGKRSALRLVLHLLRSDPNDSGRLGNVLLRLRNEIRYCRECHNVTELEVCSICADPRRDSTLLCVVEDIRDVIAVENTQQFKGKYHVLGGIISPMDGIGPGNLTIEPLLERLKGMEIQEVIMALSATMEGDTTTFYLYKRLQQLNRTDLRCSTIARGVSIGDELEYADEVTLGRSILQRVPYDQSIAR